LSLLLACVFGLWACDKGELGAADGQAQFDGNQQSSDGSITSTDALQTRHESGVLPKSDALSSTTLSYQGPAEVWVLEGSEGHVGFRVEAGPTGDAQSVTVSVAGTSDDKLLPAAGVEARCTLSVNGCEGHLIITPAPGELGSGSVELEINDGAQAKTVTLAVKVEATVVSTSPRYVSAHADGKGDGSMSSPWTMAQANTNASAGDTVRIGPGRYQTGLVPAKNGTAAAPIRFVALQRRRAIIEDNGSESHLLNLDSRKYIQVSGLRFEVKSSSGLSSFDDSEFVSVDDSTLLGYGVFVSAGVRIDGAKSLDLRNTRMERSFHNLMVVQNSANVRLQGVVIGRSGHAPMFAGAGLESMIIRGSAFLAGWGRPAGISYGPTGLLFERNVVSGGIDGHRSAGAEMKVTGTGGIYRYNRLHDNGPGAFTMRDGGGDRRIDHVRLYGNVVHNNSGQAFWLDSVGDGIFRDIAFQNNVFLDNDANGARYHFRGSRVYGEVRMTSNLFHHTAGAAPNPTEVVGCPDDGNLFEAPGYVDVARHSYLELQASSPLAEGGTPLTQTLFAGHGRDLQVKDAWWAFDGFSLPGEVGDLIQVGSEQARVVAVDQAKGVITVDRDLTWVSGVPVSPAWQGAAPSLGCFEEGGGLEHLGILSSVGTAGSGDVVRFEILGAQADAQVVWHLGDGTRATGRVVEHAYNAGEGRFGVRAYVYGGKSWQRAATSLLISDPVQGAPVVLLEFDLDDEVAKIQTDSWSRPMADIRRVDAPRGKGVRIEVSAVDGGLQSRFSPGWDIKAHPIMKVSYRIDSGIDLDVSLVAYSDGTSVRTRSVTVGGTGGLLTADGKWHELKIDAGQRNDFPDATHLLGVSFNGPKGQGVGKGYEFDWVCISAAGQC
ncbi:MAG: right-handed parallel beta-helix repeat-containing protein, partial [Deltaproteobacteria bacterium]|nr:right-handed parallel beta-helix repeat-containing protein [Deltaproteobacteria bacterium]